MPDQIRRPTFNIDLDPVRVKDLAPVYEDVDEAKEGDSTDTKSKSRTRTRQQQMSFAQEGEAIATYEPFWNRATSYMERESQKTLLGRPRECSSADVFFAHQMQKLYSSEARAFKELGDQENWNRLRRAAQEAFPENKERRLSEHPPSIHQVRRFMKRHILNDPTEMTWLEDDFIDSAVEAALRIDLLNPKVGKINKPDKTRVVYGDASFVRGRFNASRTEAIDPETGEIVRQFDPDAHSHTGNNMNERGSPGFTVMLLGVRGGFPNERIPLILTTKDPHVSEPDDFVQKVERLVKKYPAVRKGMIGVTYDMALKPIHLQKLLKLGLIPFIKVSLTNQGKVPVVTLLDHEIHLTSGTTTTVDVHLVDGTPCLAFVDGEGEFCYQPLRRAKSYRVKDDAMTEEHISFRWYGDWEVPANPLLEELVGALIRIRLDSPLDRNLAGWRGFGDSRWLLTWGFVLWVGVLAGFCRGDICLTA